MEEVRRGGKESVSSLILVFTVSHVWTHPLVAFLGTSSLISYVHAHTDAAAYLSCLELDSDDMSQGLVQKLDWYS
jgi:hypothetical protein